LRQLKPELDVFIERYLPLFGRAENHSHARRFIQGLLAGGDRRNVENIAETINGGVVRTLQKFISQGAWGAGDTLQELRQHVVEVLGDADAVLIVDETGFPKKGTKSVGVARQYAGTMGRIDNCQVGVFIDYCSAKGHVLCDRRLFIPQAWFADRPRCDAAGIPAAAIFRTKPELALEMIQQAALEDVPFRWVAGDCVYGGSPTFVQGLRSLQKWYVLDVTSEARVWTSKPRYRPLGRTTARGGKPTSKIKTLEAPRPVGEVIASIPATAWQRVVVAEGSQGPRLYEYAELTVWFSEESLPTPEPERLLVRRSLDQAPELKFQRSNAPLTVLLRKLAEVAGCRWCVEQDFQAAKGECGLDEYETRGWVGWHHHTVLSLLALWFLTLQKERLGKKTSAAHRAGGSYRAPLSTRPAEMGRTRNHQMVSMATTTKRRSKNSARRPPRAAPTLLAR